MDVNYPELAKGGDRKQTDRCQGVIKVMGADLSVKCEASV